MAQEQLLTENDIDIVSVGILYDIVPDTFQENEKYLGLICSCILDSNKEDLEGLYEQLREVLQNDN